MLHHRINIVPLLILLLSGFSAVRLEAGINRKSAWMPLFSQRTEISLKDTLPVTRTEYELVFRYEDEKAISMFGTYDFSFSHFEKIESIEAWSDCPQPGGKTKRFTVKDFTPHHAKSGETFHDDHQEISIRFMGLTPGSEAHLKYTVLSTECHFTDIMVFRSYLPIEQARFELLVPENMNVSLIKKNLPEHFVTYTTESKRKATLHTWLGKEVEEEKRYEGAPARLYFTPHILFKIDDYQIGSKTYTYSKTYQDLYRWYKYHFRELNRGPSDQVKKITDSLCKGVEDKTERAKRIYAWVQKEIRYVAFEAGLEGIVPRNAEVVCGKRYGDCKDKSNILQVMLQLAGVDAHLCWIGTRDVPYRYSEVPLKNTDNHMITAVREKDSWIFLDATDPSGFYGLPADHIQGKEAMIDMGDHAELAMVPVVGSAVNRSYESTEINLKSNQAEMRSYTAMHGALSGNLMNRLLYLNEKEKDDFAKGWIKSGSNNAQLKSYRLPLGNDQRRGDTLHFEFYIPDLAKKVEDELYLNLYLDKPFQNMTVMEPERKVPMALRYNLRSTDRYELQIPDGYEVAYLPPAKEIMKPEFGFKTVTRQEGSKIICEHEVYTDAPNLLIEEALFPAWNAYIKQLNEVYRETVVLRKK